MKIQCDACEGAAATVVCCADEAALCARCDVEVHAANKLAGKHQRLPLEALSARLPRCDVCQEKAAFIFCVEDRALFCRDCDEPIHVPGTLSGNHQRYLATGIRVGFASASACGGADDAHDADHHAAPHCKLAVEQPPPARRSRCPRRRSSCRRAGPSTSSYSSPTTRAPPSTSCTRSRRWGSGNWSGSTASSSSTTSRPPRPAGRWRRCPSSSVRRRPATRRTTGRTRAPPPACARARRPGWRSPTMRTTTSSFPILVKRSKRVSLACSSPVMLLYNQERCVSTVLLCTT